MTSKKNSRKDSESGIDNHSTRRQSAINALNKIKSERKEKIFISVKIDDKTWVEREVN
jgi:hypothetical protein